MQLTRGLHGSDADDKSPRSSLHLHRLHTGHGPCAAGLIVATALDAKPAGVTPIAAEKRKGRKRYEGREGKGRQRGGGCLRAPGVATEPVHARRVSYSSACSAAHLLGAIQYTPASKRNDMIHTLLQATSQRLRMHAAQGATVCQWCVRVRQRTSCESPGMTPLPSQGIRGSASMPQLEGPSVSKIQRQYWYCDATPHRATGHDLLHNVVVAVDIVHLAHGHLVEALHRHAAAAAAVLASVHAVAIEVVGLVPISAISIIIKP